MKTIKEEVINEIIINKSRFITILININNINEVNTKINEYKKRYKDATHYCTAYIINGYEKCDDDKEPSGTAGMPILNVLKKQNLRRGVRVSPGLPGGGRWDDGGPAVRGGPVPLPGLRPLRLLRAGGGPGGGPAGRGVSELLRVPA